MKKRLFTDKQKERMRAYWRSFRRNNPEKSVLKDCRRSDKKKGFCNDITLDFLIESFRNPCSYCGDDSCRKTLDRIDNERGHTVDNVVVSCERCNYTRRDMPYSAWLSIAPVMRKLREEGLFGQWRGRIHKREEPTIDLRVKSEPKHGDLSMYNHRKCRCELCRKANSAQKARLRSR